MGKGDMKTKKGKTNRGTFGASRPKKKSNKAAKGKNLK
ncbi:30S ribosomal protein THX [Algoriphagus halophilus]